ncbi:hypothetical protein [Citricoccus sp. NR2]|uniref:hypothetical protein n=1 Tax=Citricoccus sp. NR2 TaxID=3004095 RepID=UPI0022DDC64D|nr:hypothetical protein [Citricoccus sp. NR2]WBL17855.1 hypothetical protein O1A05_08515 [Citricoccus sp. NR2]
MGAAIALVVIPLTVAQFCIGSAMLIGGSNWSPQVAGWGGFIGGALFGVILMLMSVGQLLQIETVVRPSVYRPIFVVVTVLAFCLSFVPFTALVNNVYPVLGWLGIPPGG